MLSLRVTGDKSFVAFVIGYVRSRVEFKQSKSKLNKDVYESVCAFLNRNGGIWY